ncbi:unnamed protein product [Gulo gulo]|uniref:Uncharacterized protein n=1 Tax=Gulo gulo TaxID=48420 RepID=A0A9X9MCY6_GULGU|nr:unnamed protein product [Gulo gulo]
MAYSILLRANMGGLKKRDKKRKSKKSKRAQGRAPDVFFHQLTAELLFFLWFLLLATKLGFWFPYKNFPCEMRVILDGRRAAVFTG